MRPEPDAWLREGISPKLQSHRTIQPGGERIPQKETELFRSVARKLISVTATYNTAIFEIGGISHISHRNVTRRYILLSNTRNTRLLG